MDPKTLGVLGPCNHARVDERSPGTKCAAFSCATVSKNNRSRPGRGRAMITGLLRRAVEFGVAVLPPEPGSKTVYPRLHPAAL